MEPGIGTDSSRSKDLSELQEEKERRQRDLLEVLEAGTDAFSLADDSKVLNAR